MYVETTSLTNSQALNSCPSVPPSLLHANREELTDISLDITQVGEKEFPQDLKGHVFIVAPAGTVDSGGLPFSDGDSFLSGDGMVYRLDFDRLGEVRLTTRIVKPPDYYADKASRSDDKYAKYRFHNHGIIRFSLGLGSRNQLSIGFQPLQCPGDTQARLLVTYDAGRHYEIDTETLKVATPVGWNREWRGETKLNFAFQPILSTAHPAFDFREGELFTVNYGRSLGSFLNLPVFSRALDTFNGQVAKHFPHVAKFVEKFELLEDFLYLIRWDGKGDLERWRLVLPDGSPVKITQSIHQMAVTQDYIVIVDTSFTTGIEQVINNPLPEHTNLENRVRRRLDCAPCARTDVYVVSRKDLGNGQKPRSSREEVPVTARKLELPLEVTHFLVDYDNPQGLITLHAAHTTAWDVSEWVRSYDVSAYAPHEPVLTRLRGMEQSEMDISRVGRYVINGETAEVVEQKVIPQVFDRDAEDCRCTWGVALYAYLDRMPSSLYPTLPPGKLDNIYWVSLGLWQELVTKFMSDFFKDYTPRKVPLAELLEIAKEEGRPSCLFRVHTGSTDTMGVADCYEFPAGHIGLSPQFIPRGDGSSSTDGYLTCTVWFGDRYEIWIFEADNLKQGPRWKLSHPSLNFGLTLHTAWLPQIGKRQASYHIPVREDFQEIVKHQSQNVRELFEREIYPHFSEE